MTSYTLKDANGVTQTVTVTVPGTAGTPNTDVVTVQGIASMTALKVDGSAVTQPVSAAALPLPSGAATSAAQTTGNNSLSSIDGKVTACNTGAVTVSSSALPSGAATAAKQPALGAAGSASADVISIQGVASMTAVKVDGSAVVQPASQSGTWTVQPGNTANTTAWKVDGSAVNQPVITGSTVITGATLTRPSDTTAYASGDLVANSTTAGSVTPIQFTVARANDKPFTITKAGLQKSTTGTTGAQFRLHLWNVSPTVANGDNGAISATKSGYIGSFDFDMSLNAIFSDGARANGAPSTGNSMIGLPATGTQLIYGLLEARGAYPPGNAETFVPFLEVIQD